MHKSLVITAALISAAAFSGTASAQMSETTSTAESWDKAPRNAAEITVGAGYTQGLGQIQKGSANNINDVANGGLGVDLGVGYRISPNIGVAVGGQYQELSTTYTNSTNARARGLALGIDGTYHFMPNDQYDPWLRVGTGYRMLWQVPNNARTVLYHGFDIVRVAIGVDFKNNANFAFGPMLGADLNTFLWARPENGTNTAITDPRVNTFVYAGLQGRFDVGGTRETAGGRQMAAANGWSF